MRRFITVIRIFLLAVILAATLPEAALSQQFIHPGINQTSKDLAYMKSLVDQGKQPWRGAFERLQAETDLSDTVTPYAHVLRGPYGKPNIGGRELSKSAQTAYNCALLWYITGEKSYANKAIAILNAWSGTLWDFDYNDAKLLAAWTGHVFCNAAEILRYTPSGWQKKDIDRFTNMLMTVYYPLIRFYFPTANGNWNGAIIHSILAIAIFTDNRPMFNNAVDHFLHGPVNESIFKYIYPSGQCQESTRDQGHVQLGLGEFAGAAQVAYTQGVDLFSIGNNRIALGFAYTARFLLGEKPYCYGIISERSKSFRDDYQYVYRHYSAQGLKIPTIKKAADSTRPHASRSILAAVRVPKPKTSRPQVQLTPYVKDHIAGAGAADTMVIPAGANLVGVGQSIQEALDAAAGTGRQVMVKAGVHRLKATLKIPSGVILSGQGSGTILLLDPASGERDALENASDDLHDLTIRDLVVEGAEKPFPGTDPNSSRSFHSKYNRGGIIFRAGKVGQMKHLHLINLTVKDCTFDGVLISGATDVQITNCDFDENGSSVIPGPKLQHNLFVTHCTKVDITRSRLDTSPYGSGIALGDCSGVSIENNEVARNAFYGILLSECKDVSIKGNLIEANDRSGVMVEFLHSGSENITILNNLIHFNQGYAVESYGATNLKTTDNTCRGNGTYTGEISTRDQLNISKEKKVIMH
ncbi:MAG TPA: right-handed parallel beta-helix repeat-containing protein [Chitinophagaceae bacterium]|nr:right-handed parallel beta-helix repeat-containing protein [Chitinophagaceae bacterium]